MFKGFIPLAVFATVVGLCAVLTESQCTTKYCDDQGEEVLESLCRRNQDIVDQLQRVVGQLQDEVTEPKETLASQNKPRFGMTRHDAARSCRQILDGEPEAANGVYWVCASSNCAVARELFCDMRNGDWTLIGQIGGVNSDIYAKWLVSNENTGMLRSPVIEAGTYGCMDAVDMAVNYAHDIRLSSGENDTGMGQNWVEWALPSDRDVDTFWRFSVGSKSVESATHHRVGVRSSFTHERTCYQNKYGMRAYYGGGYPSTAFNPLTIGGHDVSFTVSVMSRGSSVYGFKQTYISDAPASNSDWPNAEFRGKPPFVSVWLR